MKNGVEAPTLGVIVGNRGFFPDHLCAAGRETILKVLEKEGINAITLTPEDSSFGSVESLTDAQKSADLFKAHREEIDGILVTLPNFGDERAIATEGNRRDHPLMPQRFTDQLASVHIPEPGGLVDTTRQDA